MTISAPFGSISEADSTYYSGSDGGDGSGDGGGDGSGEWGDLQSVEALGAGWVLAKQEATDGSRTRWFVIRSTDGQLEALNTAGKAVAAKESDTLDSLPHFPDEEDARAAFKKWAEENGVNPDQPGTEPNGSSEWGEWQKVRQIGNWWIFARTHKTEDRAQFLLTGKNEAGDTIYLNGEGKVVSEPYLFESVDELRAALEAYNSRKANGEVPESKQPTGEAPSKGEVAKSVTKSTTTKTATQSSQVERMIEKLGGQKIVLGVLVVVAIIAYQQRKKEAAS